MVESVTSKTVTVLTAAKITELTTKFPGMGEDTFVHERDYNQAENGRVARADQIERLQRERDAWESTAAQFARNMEYYRSLVDRVGCAIGKEAYTADDGSISDDVLRAKVPEIIERLLKATPVETTPVISETAEISEEAWKSLKPGALQFVRATELFDHYPVGTLFQKKADGRILAMTPDGATLQARAPVEPVAPPSGEVVLPGRLGHTAWCQHTLTVELNFKEPSPCNCGAALPAVNGTGDGR